ncbi:MAG: VanZ family protein [Pyrinomonadaceae bacterium]
MDDRSLHGRILRYGPLAAWIVVILVLGSGMGSMNETSRFIRPLLEFLFPEAPPETLAIYHGYIRKLAHFAEYGVLALFAARAFATSSSAVLARNFWVASAALALIVAAIDEFRQSYDPSRTSSVYDVLIDLSGAAAALIIVAAVRRRTSR